MTRDWGENARSEKTCGGVDQRRQEWEQHAQSKVLEEYAGEQLGQVCVQGSGGEGGRGGQACSEAGREGRAGLLPPVPAQVLAGEESLGGESFWAGMEQRQGRGWAGGGPVGPTGWA